jgi:hypothetical protein
VIKLKAGSEDGTHVPKHVVPDRELHLLETMLCCQEYNKHCLQWVFILSILRFLQTHFILLVKGHKKRNTFSRKQINFRWESIVAYGIRFLMFLPTFIVVFLSNPQWSFVREDKERNCKSRNELHVMFSLDFLTSLHYCWAILGGRFLFSYPQYILY